ncbi:MAG: 2-oxo-4-hydroxy-4-carboxy-5-ureidoimidazoline decarboxylase [Acidobacteriota bacterium]|nr:2-oxo-4-hydroxy-4-carboxy-5-ureidoimidazoline decarboxylase [Acidobacteriota bacterium]
MSGGEGLERLNQASSETAQAQLLDCCGSQKWARAMTEARPFANLTELLDEAARIWRGLDAADWLEAFAAHPKIGARRTAPKQTAQSARWSHGEQSGASSADGSVLDAMAEANRLYERKFGYIFIVCATGKSAEEMLEICRRRLDNEPEAELEIAAEEQRKITEIRLKKLLAAEN